MTTPIVHNWMKICFCGQRVGLIRFGSRLDVYVPLEAEVWAKPEQRVRAGETILGRLP